MAGRPKLLPPYRVHHGLIVWLDNCPPLDDDADREKRRPIVIVEPELPGWPQATPVAMAICCSTTYGASEPDGLLMPNLTTEPQTTTGLPQVCWAIPRWYLPVSHATINACDHSGRLGGRKLQQLLLAYVGRVKGAGGTLPTPK